MTPRYDLTNIPTELLRTLVTCADSGNIAKAAAALDLTQTAVGAQIKRLQLLLGKQVFTRPEGQLRLTHYGAIVLSYSRRILNMNDQIVSLSGANSARQQYRIGMPKWVADRRLVDIIRNCSAVHSREDMSFRTDSLENLMRDLSTGALDFAFLCNVSRAPGVAAAEWLEPLYWVRSPAFVLRPGAPVPLVSCSGSLSDRVAIKGFETAGIPYSIAFSSPELGSRIAAVVAGLGLMLVTDRCITPELEVAQEPYLPTPPQIKTGIYVREGLDMRRIEALLRAFEAALAPRQPRIAPAKPRDTAVVVSLATEKANLRRNSPQHGRPAE
jgi:DNA-binding transcriptional LysR family regulator